MAKEACEQGRVFINGKEAKAGDEVKIGDIVEVNFANSSVKIESIKNFRQCKKKMMQQNYIKLLIKAFVIKAFFLFHKY